MELWNDYEISQNSNGLQMILPETLKLKSLFYESRFSFLTKENFVFSKVREL